MKFDLHIDKKCKEVGRKVSALSRLYNCLTRQQKKTALEAYINSQFNYGSALWMFCSRKSNNKINRVHERALRIAFDDYTSTFKDLLDKCGSETKHVRNIKKVAIEMYKVNKGTSPKIISDLFSEREFSSTRSGSFFNVSSRNTVFKGDMSLRTYGPKVWNEFLPHNLKNIDSFEKFKTEVKKWIPECNCRLCRVYVQSVGFIS